MRLRVVGDRIVEADSTVVAVFDPQLLPTLRNKAEALLLRGAVEGDWELTERVFEQQTRIQELEERQAELERELAIASTRLAEIIEERGVDW